MELTKASWSSLEPSERKQLFSQVLIRAERVAAISDIRNIAAEPLDEFLPAAIAEMERKMEPAGAEMATVAIELACRILRCRKPEGQILVGYIAILRDAPADLLIPSIHAALGKETHHVLPTPGALLEMSRIRQREREKRLLRARDAERRLQIAHAWRRRRVMA